MASRTWQSWLPRFSPPAGVYAPVPTNRRWFKLVTAATVLSFSFIAGEGVAYANAARVATDRAQRANDIAARHGWDVRMVLDPEAFDRDFRAQAEQRRRDAVERMRRKYGPDPAKVAAVEARAIEIAAKHLPSRLAGLSRDMDEAERAAQALQSGRLSEQERDYTQRKLEALSTSLRASGAQLGKVLEKDAAGLPAGHEHRRVAERLSRELKGKTERIHGAVTRTKTAEERGRALDDLRRELGGRKPATPAKRVLRPPSPLEDAPALEPRLLEKQLWKTGALTPALREFYADVADTPAVVPTPAGLVSATELAAGFDPAAVPQLEYASLGGVLYDATELLLDQAEGALPPPTAADLAETPDVRFTPELLQLAASLGNNPIRLYNYVHDDLDSEVYYGSRKGSEGALATAAGNDFDLSSLLVALLRASGIPARYEYGTVTLTPEQAMAWTGTQNATAAGDFLATAGFPGRRILDATRQVTGIQIEHVWVRAYVPYGNYRGLPPSTGEHVWVRLDPTIKRYDLGNAVDLRGAVHFDFAAYRSGVQERTPREVFEAQLRAHIQTAGIACNTLDDATVQRTRVPDALEILPGDLPMPVISSLLVFAEVPSSFRQKVVYQLGTLSHRLELPALFGKRVALRYRGATATDQQRIDAAGGVRYLPAYRVNLVPTLRVDDAEVAVGAAVRPGTDQELRATLEGPRFTYAPEVHYLTAGAVYALLVDAAGLPASIIEDRESRLAARLSDNAGEEEVEEARAQLALAKYFYDTGAAIERTLAVQRFGTFHHVNEGMATRALNAAYLDGQPVAISPGDYMIDVTRLALSPVALDADQELRVELALVTGYEVSVGEHRVWEATIHGVGTSAVKTLGAAAEQGISVLTIDSSNSSTIPTLPYSAQAREDLANLAAQGLRITIPASPVTYGPFPSIEAYVAEDLRTGSGVYRLFGTKNGGACQAATNNGTGGHGCCCSAACASPGSQVDVAFGSYEFSETDVTLPGVGIPIVLSRTYRSKTLGPVSGILGAQWQSSYDVHLRADADGGRTLVDGRLNEWRFAPGAGGGFTRPPGYHATLTATGTGWELTQQDGSRHVFDEAGRLVELADTNGNRVTVVRDGAGRPTQVRDSSNSVALTFAYGPEGLLQAVTDRAGRTVGYEHVGTDLTAVVDVLGERQAYEYDGAHRVVGRVDRRGSRTTLQYDSEGRWTGLIDAAGSAVAVAYDFANRSAVYTDKRGSATVWEYNATANPTAVTDPLGNRRGMEWDADRNKLADADARGSRTSMTYDSEGNLLTRTDPLDATSTYTYDSGGRILTVTDAENHVTTNTYDGAGNLLSTDDAAHSLTAYNYRADEMLDQIVQPGGAVTSFGYDAVGNIQTMTDPEGGVTVLGYSAAGHLSSITDPNTETRSLTPDAAGRIQSLSDALGRTTTFEYDPEGNRTAVVDPLLARTSFDYDDMNRVVAVTDPAGNVTRTEYDAAGATVARVDARGNRTTYAYDAAGRLSEVTDAQGNTSSTFYCADVGGQPCAVVDPLGNVTEVTFDELGRPISTIDANGFATSQDYDRLGRRRTTTDANLNVTTFGYDDLGRLSTVTDAKLGTTTYGYDARGNRTSVLDANDGLTEFTYDRANRLLAETNPIGDVTTFEYDLAGNRRFKTDGNGARIEYVYDPNRRLTDVLFPDATGYHFDYDERGARTLERSPSHERRLSYDPLGRLQQVQDLTLGRTISYGYDPLGNRSELRLDTGEVTRYRWDAVGRLAELTDPDGDLYRFYYDPSGRRSRVSFPNNTFANYAYDRVGQVTDIAYATRAGDVLTSFHYTHDAAGNRLSKGFADGTAEVYGYDELHRLTDVTYPGGRAVHYEMDPLGNRLSLTETTPSGTTVESYSYNAFNELLSVTAPSGVTSFAYDGNGNQTRKTGPEGVTEFLWDVDNRLRTIQYPGGSTNSFAYDANGLRVRVEDSYGTRDQLLDGISVVAEYQAGARSAWYVQSPARIDELLSLTNASGKLYPHLDALGSLYSVAGSAGAVAARASYDAYGARSGGLDQLGISFGYTGREHGDGDLAYNRARYLSVAEGRWTAPDPLGMPGGADRYLYGGNPVRFTDPLGTLIEEPSDDRAWWAFRRAIQDGVVWSLYITLLTDTKRIFRFSSGRLPTLPGLIDRAFQQNTAGRVFLASDGSGFLESCGNGLPIYEVRIDFAVIDRHNASYAMESTGTAVSDMEVYVHEMSHAVDVVFDRFEKDLPDEERRAYSWQMIYRVLNGYTLDFEMLIPPDYNPF